MSGRHSGRANPRHRHVRPPPPSVPPPKVDEKAKLEKKQSSGIVVQIHPLWLDLPQGQGELFFECTLFLYSVLALFLQYLNLYKTLWWLPKSYWHYSMKFHLINPYLLSCVGLLLGIRVTKCFWNAITDLVRTIVTGKSGFNYWFWKFLEYCLIKAPLFAMIFWSFMFSFSRVYNDFSINAVVYFGHPVVLYILFFYQVLKPKLKHMWMDFYDLLSGSTTPTKENDAKRQPMVDIESVVHMCSREPNQVREEASVLITDLYLRIKYCIFTGIATAYFSIYLPCAFTPQKTITGITQHMLIDVVWVSQLFIIVALTSFSLYMTYLFPIQYCDLLHRSASHLGFWQPISVLPHDVVSSMVPKWKTEDAIYSNGSIVEYNGQYYKARAFHDALGIAAEPGNSDHLRFYRVAQDPVSMIMAMSIFQFGLIGAQFGLLMMTTDWQHIVTLVLLMFANYMLLGKMFKDWVVISRIYKPSDEDQQLVKQLQSEPLHSAT